MKRLSRHLLRYFLFAIINKPTRQQVDEESQVDENCEVDNQLPKVEKKFDDTEDKNKLGPAVEYVPQESLQSEPRDSEVELKTLDYTNKNAVDDESDKGFRQNHLHAVFGQ